MSESAFEQWWVGNDVPDGTYLELAQAAWNAALATTICRWTLDNTDAFYHTECDNAFVTNEGTWQDNDMKYCPFCGGNIKEEMSNGE